jgi:hypothetical protein
MTTSRCGFRYGGGTLLALMVLNGLIGQELWVNGSRQFAGLPAAVVYLSSEWTVSVTVRPTTSRGSSYLYAAPYVDSRTLLVCVRTYDLHTFRVLSRTSFLLSTQLLAGLTTSLPLPLLALLIWLYVRSKPAHPSYARGAMTELSFGHDAAGCRSRAELRPSGCRLLASAEPFPATSSSQVSIERRSKA